MVDPSPSPRPELRRVRICGTLTCAGDLHVGDGGSEPWKQDQTRKGRDLPEYHEPPHTDTGDDIDPDYHRVCWTPGLGPYLPGSSLRGSLRGLMPADDPLTRLWFGYVPATGADPAEGPGGRAGKLRVYDAFLCDPAPFREDQAPAFWSAARQTSVRHGIAIDPITGTAGHRLLYSHELVPAGSAFRCDIEADNLDRAELALLLGLLARWDGGLWSSLGGKRGKGWGRVTWACESVCGLDPSGLAAWLAQDPLPLEAFFADLSDLVPVAPPAAPARVEAGYRLLADGPILVNEPGYRRSKQGPDDTRPTHEYSRRPDGTPLIPGKGLVGALRGRARRILASIALSQTTPPDAAIRAAEALVGEVFGDTGRRGALWVSDAEPQPQTQCPPQSHEQFFNAIDRFSGGVRGPAGEGALFQVNACTDGEYQGTLLLERHRLPAGDWWKGLLLFLARDAIEGDLALGWGKAKGYGAVHARLIAGEQTLADWQGLLTWARALGEGEPGDWIHALHDRIRDELKQVNQGQEETQP